MFVFLPQSFFPNFHHKFSLKNVGTGHNKSLSQNVIQDFAESSNISALGFPVRPAHYQFSLKRITGFRNTLISEQYTVGCIDFSKN